MNKNDQSQEPKKEIPAHKGVDLPHSAYSVLAMASHMQHMHIDVKKARMSYFPIENGSPSSKEELFCVEIPACPGI